MKTLFEFDLLQNLDLSENEMSLCDDFEILMSHIPDTEINRFENFAH